MMTTVTTTTTTVITAISIKQALALGAIAAALLIALLVLKEILVAYAAETRLQGSWKARAARAYAANLNIAITPLMFIFVLTLVTKIVSAL